MGQFYMLRAWNEYPVLSRPISVFDADPETVSFLYKVVGKGTEIFAGLKAGDEITLDGPHGNGFPEVKGKVALVGGGVGIAPVSYTHLERLFSMVPIPMRTKPSEISSVRIAIAFSTTCFLQEASSSLV